MANGEAHEKVGMAAGGIAAFLFSDGAEPLPKRLAEAAGGIVGGWTGGKLPDILEPAIHSWHRSVAHSATAGVGVIAMAARWLDASQTACRARADHFAARQLDPTVSDLERLLYAAAELFWRAAAGFIVGAAAGYLSHLALDAATPRGLPMICRGL